MNPGRPLLGSLAIACGAGSVVHLLSVARWDPGAALLGLWLAGPTLLLGGVQFFLAWEARPQTLGAPRVVGLWAGSLMLMAVIVLSQLIVSGNRSSTAALLYLFAPVYASVLGAFAWLVGWAATKGILRLSRDGSAAQ